MRITIKQECKVLIAFALTVLAVFYGVPLVRMLTGSVLGSAPLGSPGPFVGWANYYRMWDDPTFGQAFLASVAFTLPAVGLQVGFAFAAALLTRRSFPTVAILRAMLIAPYFLSSVVVVVAWRFFSDPFVGLLPEAARWLGFAAPDFRGPTAALPVMILVATYEAFPFTYVVLLARMVQIPESLYEVSELDGASPWRTFLTVTWPQVRLTVWGLVLLRILITWLKFDVPWLVYASAASSPWGDTLAVTIYRTAFEKLKGGEAYAASLTLLCATWAFYATWSAAIHLRKRPSVATDALRLDQSYKR